MISNQDKNQLDRRWPWGSKSAVGIEYSLCLSCVVNHRITECSRLEGTSVGHPVQPPAKAGSPTAGHLVQVGLEYLQRRRQEKE